MRVYRYGLRTPTVNADLVRQQLRLAWEYRRALTQAREVAREARRQVERDSGLGSELEDVRAAEERAAELGSLARQARQQGRSREAVPAALRAELTAARASVRDARRALSDRRKALREQMAPARDRAHEEWLQARRKLRGEYAARGLRHGTYTAVEDAVEQSDKTTPLWEGAEPNRIRWPSWTGEGRFGEQIQGGLTLAFLAEGNTRCVLPPGRYTTLRLRVGSEDDRSPVWAEFPAKIHRPIPEGSTVKRAMVQLRREGPREIWTLDLVVDEPADYRREPCGEGVVAVDIGWRRYPDRDGLRVAAWHDGQGRSGMVELAAEQVTALRYPEDLRAQRDRNMDAMRSQVCALLREAGELPEWLRQATVRRGDDLPTSAQAVARLAQWRSPARWAWLVREVAKHQEPMAAAAGSLASPGPSGRTRNEGSAEPGCRDDLHELARVLEDWRYHDHHLWAWECGQRGKAIRRRQDHYRVTAAWLARTYQTVVVEVFDIRDVAERPEPDQSETQQTERARSWRQLAAVSTLRDAIRQAVMARGGEYIQVDAAHTTQECPFEDCQHIEPWDAAAQVDRRPPCPACGRMWDQDDGAARVMLRRHRRERKGGEKTVGSARSDDAAVGCPEPRWQRVKRMRAEKVVRMEALEKE